MSTPEIRATVLEQVEAINAIERTGRKVDPSNPTAAMLASERRAFERRSRAVQLMTDSLPTTDTPAAALLRLLSLEEN